MKTNTVQILKVMQILAWIAFIGYAIEAGAILISFGVSCINPEGAKNLYKGLDLFDLRQFNFFDYTMSVSFMVVLSIMKSYIWYLAIKTLSKINLVNPFKMEVARTIERISYVLFGAWVIGSLANANFNWLMQKTGEISGQSNAMHEFLFMAGLIFIISQVFKRGVEIQSESELTI